MKKIFLTLLVAVASVGASAQGVKWEGQIGMNLSKFTTLESKVGFNVGVRAKLELPKLANGVYANAGALLSFKGGKIGNDELGVTSSANYIEIPIHAGFQYDINDKFRVFGEFGPYFAIGLFGNTEYKMNLDVRDLVGDDYYDAAIAAGYDPSEEKKDESHSTFDEISRFDFGLGFRVGAEFKKKYIVSLGYDFGLLDLNKEKSLITTKSRNFWIGLGYRF
ncbi:MAG: PorT family protein [Alloprevotella sp.]|nr:PorT family protein [Alloprevotella sp.]